MNWTIIRGETKTGVTIMLMDEGMDTGDILTQEETMIGPKETFGELHDRLADMGAKLLLKIVEMIISGTAKRKPQDPSGATYAPRFKKEDGLIRWDTDVHQTVNLIRGLSPVPCAYTFFKGKKLKVYSVQGEEIPIEVPPGTVGRETEIGLPVTARSEGVNRSQAGRGRSIFRRKIAFRRQTVGRKHGPVPFPPTRSDRQGANIRRRRIARHFAPGGDDIPRPGLGIASGNRRGNRLGRAVAQHFHRVDVSRQNRSRPRRFADFLQ